MDFFIFLVAFSCVTGTSGNYNRRQSVAYTHNFRFPDQHAQSSNAYQTEIFSPKIHPYTTPKSVRDYRQEVQIGSPKQLETGRLEADRTAFQGRGRGGFREEVQKSGGQVQQSQSFNVGYSVKFGGPQKGHKAKYESDVITGSYKEEVRNPFGTSPSLDDAKLIQQAYLTPKTKLAYLDNFQKAEASPWRSLSPSVEIYKSREVQSFGQGYRKGFDHVKALGKSEGFDYTNAVDLKPYQSSKVQFGHAGPNQRGNGIYGSSPKVNVKLPIDTSLIRDPVYGSSPKVNVKLPIDTSLIRDPVLTTSKEVQMSSKQIPIHFDTTLIQQMSKSNLDQYVPLNTQHLDFNYQQVKPLQTPQNSQSLDFNYEQEKSPKALQQNHQSLDLNFESKSPKALQFRQVQPAQSNNVYQVNFAYPQNGLFDPQIMRSSKSNSYSVNESVEDNFEPQQTQFKVFAKPQNGFMRHEFEKSKSSAGKRSRTWEMDLRPPPMIFARRRIYV